MLESTFITGADAVLKSSGAQTAGNDLELPSSGGQSFEWAIWRHAVPVNGTPESVEIDLSISAGAQAWIGVADYNADRWELAGPYANGSELTVQSLSSQNLSPAGNIFVLIATYGETSAIVDVLHFEDDVPEPSTFFIGGKLTHLGLNVGIDGEAMVLQPGNVQAITASGGFFNFPDLSPGEYTVVPPSIEGLNVIPSHSIVNVVDANVTDVNFSADPPDDPILYTTHIKYLLAANCVECHGPTPQHNNGVRLDEYLRPDNNDVWHHAEDAYVRVFQGYCPKPPYNPLNQSQIKLIEDWIEIYDKAE